MPSVQITNSFITGFASVKLFRSNKFVQSSYILYLISYICIYIYIYIYITLNGNLAGHVKKWSISRTYIFFFIIIIYL